MAYEKVPKDYDQGRFQKLIDRITQVAKQGNKRTSDAVRDLSSSIDTKISSLEKKLSRKIEDATGQTPQLGLPVPVDLQVYEASVFGFAYVKPFAMWKYRWHIRGYEFYGDPNSGFTPNEEPYHMTGIHRGSDGDTYLNTEDTVNPLNSFVLAIGMAKYLINPITIENVTTGEKGTICNYNPLYPKYRIRAFKTSYITADWLEWNTGDVWRISKYPANKLYSIGALAVFFKRPGNFYVKARTVGWGHTFSAFTDQVQSEGISSTADLDVPVFVLPKHNCIILGEAQNNDCEIGDQASEHWGEPYCPVHGWVPWSEIIEGTREIEHFVFYGAEWCTVELVWKPIESEKKGVWYDVKRGDTLV